MSIDWDLVKDGLTPLLNGDLKELESAVIERDRAQFLRGRIAGLRFALETPERLERLERSASKKEGTGIVIA